jgi:hypothetical protein
MTGDIIKRRGKQAKHNHRGKAVIGEPRGQVPDQIDGILYPEALQQCYQQARHCAPGYQAGAE